MATHQRRETPCDGTSMLLFPHSHIYYLSLFLFSPHCPFDP